MTVVFLGMLSMMLGTIFVVLFRKRAMVKEWALFLREEKKWWLTPIVLVLLLLMALLLTQTAVPWTAFLYPVH